MWARVASTLLGLWLIAAPGLLGYGEPARATDHVVGPLVASLAYVSILPVTRPLRWAVAPFGLWLLVVPWVQGYSLTPLVNSLVVGALLTGLSGVGKAATEHFGGGWAVLLPGRSADLASPARTGRQTDTPTRER